MEEEKDWICSCGHSNNAEYVFCEDCISEKPA